MYACVYIYIYIYILCIYIYILTYLCTYIYIYKSSISMVFTCIAVASVLREAHGLNRTAMDHLAKSGTDVVNPIFSLTHLIHIGRHIRFQIWMVLLCSCMRTRIWFRDPLVSNSIGSFDLEGTYLRPWYGILALMVWSAYIIYIYQYFIWFEHIWVYFFLCARFGVSLIEICFWD